jgi:methyl-accepting chemotaxis protein
MNEIEIVVTGKDKSDLDKVADKAKRAGKEIGEGVQKGMDQAEDASKRGSKKIQDDLDDVRKKGRETGAGIAGSLSEALDGIASSMTGALGDIGGVIDGGLSGAKAGALAGGAALGAFIISGIETEIAEDRVGGMIAAQTGAAASAAEGLGDTAGAIFADNFGQSIEEVGEAMSEVFENKLIDTDAPAAAIQDITQRVMTLSTVMGEGFDRISYSAKQMVKNGIAGSVTEAMDMIGEAQERGLNASGDLLDTIDEYSTKFRDLGLSGQQAFGLIEQMMEGGARNTDLAADALKEFAIRAQDMSATTNRGFEAIGLDAEKMGQMIAAGGDSARTALGQTLDALRQMPPGVERSTAAVDLFGTKAEDLGNALYEMDLETASGDFEDFGGTVEDMMDRLSESSNVWEVWGRRISGFAGDVTDALSEVQNAVDNAPGLGDVFGVSEDMSGDPLKDIGAIRATIEDIDKGNLGSISVLKDLKAQYPEAAGAIDEYIEKKKDEASATDTSTAANQEYISTLEQIISAAAEAAGGTISLSEAQIGYNEDLASATEAMKEFAGKGLTAAKDGFDLGTEAGREMRGALNDVATGALDVMEKMQQQGATTQEVQGFVQSARDQFVRMASDMGLSAGAANRLADMLGLVPGNYAATVQVNGFEAAYARVEALENKLRQLPTNKQINLRVSTSGSGHMLAGLAHGGIVPQEPWGAATGGQRHSSTVINEAGPEVVELPSGARVATAGATRAMAEAGWLGGGGGSAPPVFMLGGPTDEIGRAMLHWLQACVKNEYGGDVVSALGQRSGAG